MRRLLYAVVLALVLLAIANELRRAGAVTSGAAERYTVEGVTALTPTEWQGRHDGANERGGPSVGSGFLAGLYHA